MKLDRRTQVALDDFWQRCGEGEPFPRALERPLALALPVALVKLPGLKLRAIENWLRCRGTVFAFPGENRPVRACVLADGGHGVIFVDAAEPADEQRCALSGAIAHFLLDYHQPRLRLVEHLSSAAAVLDGQRHANLDERLLVRLAGLPLGRFTWLMERPSAAASGAAAWKIRSRADRAAMALLAPPECVLPLLGGGPSRAAAAQLLSERFGLPPLAASAYAEALLPATSLSHFAH